MKEVYGSAFETLVGAARSWLFPSAVAVGVISGVLFPHWDAKGIFADIRDWTGARQALVAGFVILGFATLLAASARSTYRILEGYRLPKRLKLSWLKKNKDRVRRLRAESSSVGEATRADTQEALDQFPRKLRLVLPTRFGNILRSGESYGRSQFGLDLITMWYPLIAVAPDTVVSEIDQARAQLNTWVGTIVLSVSFSALSLITAVADTSWAPVAYAATAMALVLPAYGRACSVAARYAQSLRAVVDVGRRPLAEAIGVTIPPAFEDEIALWTSLSDLAAWGHDWAKSREWVATIDKWRVGQKESGTH